MKRHENTFSEQVNSSVKQHVVEITEGTFDMKSDKKTRKIDLAFFKNFVIFRIRSAVGHNIMVKFSSLKSS